MTKNKSIINTILLYSVCLTIIFTLVVDIYFLISIIFSNLQQSKIYSNIFYKSFLFYSGILIVYLFQRKNYFILNASFYYTLMLFIFGSIILGEFFDFYYEFQYWDIILHSLSGILTTYFAIRLFKKFEPQVSNAFTYFFAVCFSAFIASVWELFEFFMDYFFGLNMEKGIILNNNLNSIQLPSLTNSNDIKDYLSSAYHQFIPLIHHGTRVITPDLIDSLTDIMCALIASIIFIFVYYIIMKKVRR